MRGIRTSSCVLSALIGAACAPPARETPREPTHAAPTATPADAPACDLGPSFALTAADADRPFALTAGALVVSKQTQLVISARDERGGEAFRLRLGGESDRTTTGGAARWGLGFAVLVVGAGSGATLVLIDQGGTRAGEIRFAEDAVVDDAALAIDGGRAFVLLRTGVTTRRVELDLDTRSVVGTTPAGDVTIAASLSILGGGAGTIRPGPDAPLRGFPTSDPLATIQVPGPLVDLATARGDVRPFFALADRVGIFSEGPELLGPVRASDRDTGSLDARVLSNEQGFVLVFRRGRDVYFNLLDAEARPRGEANALGPLNGPLRVASESRQSGVVLYAAEREDNLVRVHTARCHSAEAR